MARQAKCGWLEGVRIPDYAYVLILGMKPTSFLSCGIRSAEFLKPQNCMMQKQRQSRALSIIAATALIVVQPCFAITPKPILIETSPFEVMAIDGRSLIEVGSLEVVSKPDASGKSYVYKSPVHPILQVTSPATNEIVEADLLRYFAARVQTNPDLLTKLVVRIEQAEIFRTTPVLNTVPILGLFVGTAKGFAAPFSFKLRVVFEIEEAGRVVRSHDFEHTVETENLPAGTAKSIKQSLGIVIQKYRDEVFPMLDAQVVGRYVY